MKKLGILLASLFVMALAVQNVDAQTTTSATQETTATATIVENISLEKNADLDFGYFALSSSESGGTVSIENTGERTKTGDIILLTGNPGQAADFIAHGTANGHYSVSLPAEDSFELTLSGGSEKMTIAEFVHSATGVFDATGKETFKVGGKLTVPAGQRAGTYTGTFDVTVTYN
jgi:hypothetical protein